MLHGTYAREAVDVDSIFTLSLELAVFEFKRYSVQATAFACKSCSVHATRGGTLLQVAGFTIRAGVETASKRDCGLPLHKVLKSEAIATRTAERNKTL